MEAKIALGCRAKDTITGYVGIVVAITEWLNGCRRVTIQAEELREGQPIAAQTFDVEQVALVEARPVVAPERTGGPPIAPVRAPDPTQE